MRSIFNKLESELVIVSKHTTSRKQHIAPEASSTPRDVRLAGILQLPSCQTSLMSKPRAETRLQQPITVFPFRV